MTAGWLYKLGGGKTEGSKWFKRHFAIEGNLLIYAKDTLGSVGRSPTSPQFAPNGVVLLNGCAVTQRELTAAKDGSLRYEFALARGPEEQLILAAESQADRQLWTEAIQRVIDGALPGRQRARGMEHEARASSGMGRSALDEMAKISIALDDANSRRSSLLAEAKELSERSTSASAEQGDALRAAERAKERAEGARARAEAELLQARRQLAVRRALVHYRDGRLRASFAALVSVAYDRRLA